jgi:GH24 family phage-related lysozyme (muramidase)
MAINAAGLELVKYYEGLFLDAYKDPVGVWTIGWGHTGADVHPGQHITKAEAEALLKADLQLHENFVKQVVKVPITENQIAALSSFAFNVGNGSLLESTLLKKLNVKDYEGAAAEFNRWVKGTVNGVKVTLPGLVKRRKAESQLFLSAPVVLAAVKAEIFADESDPSALADFSYQSIPIAQLGGDRDLVISIQKRLTELGYLDPPADGKFGPASSWALSQFCYANGLALGNGFTAEIANALAKPNSLLPEISAVAGDGAWINRVLSYMQAKGYWICRHPECFNIVYVEGMNPDGTLNDDRPNVFNDLRIVFSIGADGVPIFHRWEGTTEPGIFWTQNPMDPKGAARIAFGQYKSWIVGTHHAGSASAHEALVQTDDITVYRDFNRDYQRTGDKTYTGVFAINQHWGYDAPKNDLGRTSAGCLVGRSKDGHREFMALVKSDPRYRANAGYRFMTAVLPGEEVLA